MRALARSLLALAGLALAACSGDLEGGPTRPTSPGGGTVRIPDTCTEPALPIVEDMRRLSATQYRRSIEVLFDGRVAPSDRYPELGLALGTGYSTEGGLSDIGEQAVEDVVYAAEDVALAAHEVLGELLPCSAGRACAETFVDTYARRAYRRPPDAAERAALLATFDAETADGATFDEAIALVVVHLLEAPQFLYAVEDAAASRRSLSGYELATRLSFLLTDSIPDDALLDDAASGALDDRDGLIAAAERVLDSPRADTAIARFLREWTGTTEVSPADKSADLFPDFDTALARSMNESFDRFAREAIRQGTVSELLRSSDAWVDGTMADFFGVADPGGWTRVSLDPARYSGILTQPALLASLAHSDRTSYVYRGRFLRRRLLCEDLGTPPANATAEDAEIRAALPPSPTGLDHSLAVRSSPSCARCHDRIDPAGLAFERFDAIGRYHETDELGRTLDVSGTLVDVQGAELPFEGPVEMLEGLAGEPAVSECFARHVFRFTTSRLETPRDACAIAEIRTALDGSGQLRDALLGLVGSDAFRFREEAP